MAHRPPTVVSELLVSQGAEVQGPVGDRLKAALREQLKKLLASCDQVFYDSTIHNFVFYFGVNYYAQECERGFDLLVSNDGVHFDAITRDGFGDGANHGLRTICSTKQGVFLGTANPYYGTQLWSLPPTALGSISPWSPGFWGRGMPTWPEEMCTLIRPS